MTTRLLHLLAVAFASAAYAFCVFLFASFIAWRIYPYPPGANATQILAIWTVHILGEKIVQTAIVIPVLAIVAARSNRPNWKVAVSTAITAGLLFQAIAMSVYLVRFGIGPYSKHNRFWETLLTTLAASYLFGFIAVWRQYRKEQRENAIAVAPQG